MVQRVLDLSTQRVLDRGLVCGGILSHGASIRQADRRSLLIERTTTSPEFLRGTSEAEVRAVLTTGEAIEEYPDTEYRRPEMDRVVSPVRGGQSRGTAPRREVRSPATAGPLTGSGAGPTLVELSTHDDVLTLPD